MDAIWVALTFIIGLGVRLALPVAVTAGVVLWLRRWDARWQAEAEQAHLLAAQAPATPCWEAKACPPEQRAACPAYQKPTLPCWQAKRYATGRLPETCLECAVFRNAPAPLPVRAATRSARPVTSGGKSL